MHVVVIISNCNLLFSTSFAWDHEVDDDWDMEQEQRDENGHDNAYDMPEEDDDEI